MYDKIDGLLLTEAGKVPVQIKYRLPENKRIDIVFETVWLNDYDGSTRTIASPADFDGRDFIGKSELYIVLSIDGTTIHFCNTSEIKKRAAELTMKLLASKRNSYKNQYGEVRVVKDYGDSSDHNTYYEKIIFYAIPSQTSFKDVQLD